MRALLTDETIEAMAEGNERVAALVLGVRGDLDRYLRRIGRGDVPRSTRGSSTNTGICRSVLAW